MQQIEKLKELVDQFRYNLKDYTSGNFNETNTRQQFIDKFFELLGRDVNNHFGRSEQYKEVVLEDKLKIGGQAKAPDYSFRLGGRRIFFVEAKKPSVNIKDDVEPAYQIRRYSWTAKLPIGILTDFEELAIYDTRVKPNPKDKAGTARIKYLTFEEFEENREWIYNTLSKEAVEKGALDKYIQEGKKKGTQSVDVDFLNMIDDRRDALAKNIYLRYESAKKGNWDLDRLNNIVGDIVDKIIFLRIAEDKKIENLGNLETIANGKEIWKHLISYFEASDKKYNSGLFDNTEIFKKFELDDKILKQILLSLYYPACPYEFSVLGVDILGNIYEKFLGKTLVKEGRTIKTEFKPDVKKAGGVFYTPQYIVDYIVKNTVGELLKGKTPKQALELNIVDPACGSGAFLIGAYDYILNRFLEQHTLNDETIKKSIKESKIYQFKNSFHLSFAYKKEILKNMIYGVDIDRQAVAVSRLSLLLKLLEGETAETANQLFSTIDAALLPKLDNNIKCGNSLVDSSIYSPNPSKIDGDSKVWDEATIKKINAFDWEKEFVEVFAKGGFDAVIGNPPYIKEYTNKEIFDFVKLSNLAKYYQGKMDFWYLFACKGLDMLKEGGLQGFIAPNNWITSSGASKMREKIMGDSMIKSFIDFVDFKVFQNASIQTMVYILENKKPKKSYKVKYIKILDSKISEITLKSILDGEFKGLDISLYEKYNSNIDSNNLIDGKPFTFVNDEINTILDKILDNNIVYLTEKEVAQGIVAPQDFLNEKNAEILGSNFKKGDGIFYISKTEFKNTNWNDEELKIIKPFFTTDELGRYFGLNKNKSYVLYVDKEARLNISKYPNIKAHLDKFAKVITSDFGPYGLHRARDQRFFEGEKIMSLRKTSIPYMTYTDFPCYVSQTYFIIKPENIDMKYLTGILNSKLVYFRLYNKGKKQGEQLQIDKGPLLEIPIVYDESKKDKLIELVDQMITAQKRLNEAEFEDDKKVIEKQIEIIDGKIDNLVFDLYGLSEEERKIVLG